MAKKSSLKFKVGDKVMFISSRNPGMNSYLGGKKGTIRDIDTSNGSSRPQYGVEFTEEVNRGNDLNGHCKSGHGYYCHTQQLVFQNTPKIQKFKIGDRVLVTGHVSGPSRLDMHDMNGFVREVCYDTSEVGVEFDDTIKNGHNLSGLCPESKGWYVEESSLTKLEPISVVVARMNKKCSEERFVVGDRVKVVRNAPAAIMEQSGVVKKVSDTTAAVVFDGPVFGGHSLSGLCADGHGWFVNLDHLMKCDPVPVDNDDYY